MSGPFEIDQAEASYWWRTNVVAGTILSRLMLLFVAAPIALVFKGYLFVSLIIFAGIIPYGLVLRILAVKSVSEFIRDHPETLEEFEASGVITR